MGLEALGQVIALVLHDHPHSLLSQHLCRNTDWTFLGQARRDGSFRFWRTVKRMLQPWNQSLQYFSHAPRERGRGFTFFHTHAPLKSTSTSSGVWTWISFSHSVRISQQTHIFQSGSTNNQLLILKSHKTISYLGFPYGSPMVFMFVECRNAWFPAAGRLWMWIDSGFPMWVIYG